MEENKKYYDFNEILDFLCFNYKFDTKDGYPFNRNPNDITFQWGQILIPKTGIREVVMNKIYDIKDLPIKEIVMEYQIPFILKDGKEYEFGIINQDLSLSFRYDKQYKYGDINKSIYETCFYIYDNAMMTNDFYILSDEHIFPFMSYYVIDNQYGIGRTTVSHTPKEKYQFKSNRVYSDSNECNDVPDTDECGDVICCENNIDKNELLFI